MTTIRTTWNRKARPVYCFDVETRPGPWGGREFVFRNMFSIASGFDGVQRCEYLAPGFTAGALEEFIYPLRQGKVLVVAHNGRRYDLPLLNGTLLKLGLAPLGELWVTDTYSDLLKSDYAYSKSLRNMAERFGIREKGSMSEYAWERAYAGDPEYLEKLRVYNCGDVKTTLALRQVLLERSILRPPKLWRP